jgi:Domain of unknown function (DUF4168)
MRIAQHRQSWMLVLPLAAAAAFGAASLPFAPAADGQGWTPGQAAAQSFSPEFSDQKLSDAAAAIVQIASLHKSFRQRIDSAPASDKPRLASEASNALLKAITDHGLSVDEYDSIVKAAHADPVFRKKLIEHMPAASR